MELLDAGNTIPFIARYRKEATGSLDDQVLRELAERLEYLRNLEKRRAEIAASLEERYRLLPYIYSVAADVSFNGSTLMRPLIFDFPNDVEALKQKYEYMFGKSLLISPVTEPDVKSWQTYLPKKPSAPRRFRHRLSLSIIVMPGLTGNLSILARQPGELRD